jgi:cardiolipin synthase C
MAMRHAVRWVMGLFIVYCLVGCTRIPYDFPRQASYALARPDDTKLALAYQDHLQAHPDQSGFEILNTGTTALAARLMLIDSAEKTLDVQYYIFAKDRCGMLIVQHLCAAADRGVRVRLLIDDWEHTGLDAYFAAIAAHPNIELRLFNPVDGVRDWPVTRPVAYLFGPDRLHRHMHNKALIADNVMAVIGGRNLANEYFDAGSERNFGDMDLLAIGPITRDVSKMFDLFWNYPLSVPIEAWQPAPSAEQLADLHKSLDDNARQAAESEQGKAMAQMDLAAQLRQRTLPVVWSPGEFLFDDPDKTRFTIDENPSLYMARKLQALIATAQSEVLVMSPYFIPSAKGEALIKDLRDRNVRVKALTNSLASNDARPAHVAYRKYRRDMLKMGVEVYELRPDPNHQRSIATYLMNSVPVLGAAGPLGGDSAAMASLHAKVMVMDRKTIFVGSFNFDPRSIRLDTQDGIVMHSETLASQLTDFFDTHTTPSRAYHVVFRDDSPPQWWEGDSRSLWWVCEKDGQVYRYEDEPLVDPWDQFWIWVTAGLLPEEWL